LTRSFYSGFRERGLHLFRINYGGIKRLDAQGRAEGQSPAGRCLSSERRRRTDDDAYRKGASRGVLISPLRGKGTFDGPLHPACGESSIGVQGARLGGRERRGVGRFFYALGATAFSIARML
jgi:hypothetical protein